ncbi:MAG: hypothetical protein H7A25_01910 [Leptospiraceae bacterium]|nr:hypothetical protein [Leptospiraceae bacterium]
MQLVNKILRLYRDNNLHAGDVLPKDKLSGLIQALPLEEKAQLRDSWHVLIGNGILQDGDPRGPILTVKGEQLVYNEE